MQRSRSGDDQPKPGPKGSWLVGAIIGTAVMTMATQAMMLGASAAIKDATLKGG